MNNDSQKLAWFSNITGFFSFSVSSVPSFLGLFICTVIDSVSLSIFYLYYLKAVHFHMTDAVSVFSTIILYCALEKCFRIRTLQIHLTIRHIIKI